MLDTLLRIGKWQSQGKNEWDRFLDFPKIMREDKKGNRIANYTLSIVFDLDEGEVIVDQGNLKEYDEEDVSKLKAIKVKGGNNKAIYVTVPGGKLNQIYKTFFGKVGEETDKGELYEAIEKTDNTLLTTEFKNILAAIFELKSDFLNVATIENKKTGDFEINVKAIEEKLGMQRMERLILISVYLKAAKRGVPESLPFAEIPEYESFLRADFFGTTELEPKLLSSTRKLCYASGQEREDVEELDLSSRYSLNKMFVTETRNYATSFNKNKFSHNYQVSKENQEYLDYASNFLLNNGYKTRIANVDHVIIPEFRSGFDVQWEFALEGIKKKSDLLFNLRRLDDMAKIMEEESDDTIFWMNFVAFESDGNFFKATETIKDVSSFHFSKVYKTFGAIHQEMRDSGFVDWEKVMTVYREPRAFNLNTVYSLIPLRKEKEKKNKALDLFKSILENRPVKKEKLYDYFIELVLCHWYERYASYTNIHESSRDYFGITVRDCVFRYFAFFLVLKQLNLIDMEEHSANPAVSRPDESGNTYELAIQGFFNRMNLNEDQKAMFYLGRILNRVEYIQKGKTKTVIHKVNFNGMGKDEIERLRIGLMEKAKQYNSVGKIIFDDKKFADHFNSNSWEMSPQEAVFYLLTGYSFGVGAKDAKDLEIKETEEQPN